jgi:hypothetical protein
LAICSLSCATKAEAGMVVNATVRRRVAKKRISKRVKSKKRCCGSRPRCKTCPVTCKWLEKAGKATRDGKRAWVLVDVSRQELKRARAR